MGPNCINQLKLQAYDHNMKPDKNFRIKCCQRTTTLATTISDHLVNYWLSKLPVPNWYMLSNRAHTL